MKEHFGGAKADLILECVGSPQTITQAVSMARKGTDIIILGVFGDRPVVGEFADHRKACEYIDANRERATKVMIVIDK